MNLVDSHCHLDDERFDADRDQVVQRAVDAGIGSILTIGTGHGPPDLEAAIRLAERYSCVYATVGVHPHDAAKATAESPRRVAELLRHPWVVALGEIGLDYHYDFAPRDTQRGLFVEQLRIARNARRPIVIHTREAWDDTLALLEEHWKPAGLGGIMHCFSGGPQQARQCLDLGFHLSFGGIVTFPKATEVQEAARLVPLDRLLVETDSPYLAPVPHRGKRNEPAFIVHIARHLATLRGQSFEDLAAATTCNFNNLLAL